MDADAQTYNTNGASELYREHSLGTFSLPDRGFIIEQNLVRCNTSEVGRL